MKLVKHYKDMIDKELQKFLDWRLQRAAKVSPEAKEAIEHIKEFNLRGGKRIRPILVILGYRACGGKDDKAIMEAALAVELMESYLLMHDDIIDQDELRRGYLTMHKVFENKARRLYPASNSAHYGTCMAILHGDIAAILASEALVNSRFPPKRKLHALDMFNRVVVNTCFGQILDMHSEIEPLVREADVMKIHKLKTAIYTVDGPLAIGALLAGASKKQLASLSGYAIPLGIAFQVQDDILGLFGSEKEIGKSVGNDIREGKKTLLILKALENASTQERAFLNRCLGKRDISLADIEKVRDIVRRTGSLEYSLALVKDLTSKSVSALKSAPLDKNTICSLQELAVYVRDRKR